MGDILNFEAMLLRWSETSSGGSTIVLQLKDPGDLEPFKAMTLAKKGMAGQILDVTAVVQGQEGTVIEAEKPRKGGPLSVLAARWCRSPHFQAWMASESERDIPDEEAAANVVRAVCKIDSRRELDHDADAEKLFEALIRQPYMEHMESTGHDPDSPF